MFANIANIHICHLTLTLRLIFVNSGEYSRIYLDNKAPSYLVLRELSSAFDTLDHNILSIRLNEIGIHGQVHSWFMCFVSSRTSSVKINSSVSPPYVNMHGVPQGSNLGPILFIIYILPKKSICSYIS